MSNEILDALEIMWKGMLGIFAVIFIIMLCITLMNLLLVEKEVKKENED